MSELSVWENRIIHYGEESPEDLLANPFNFRRHPKEQQEALEGTLEAVGWVQNVIVNARTGHMIDGHLRVELALRRGITTVPITYVELSEAEEKLILASLDPITGLAHTDESLLQELLAELHTDNEKLAAFLETMRDGGDDTPKVGNTDEDDIPEAPKVPVSEKGELWILGKHRLYCGDSTKPEDLQALMQGEEADLVWTDPPYNVDYEGGSGAKTKIENDSLDDAAFRRFLSDSLTNMASVTREGGCAYVAYADRAGLDFMSAFESSGWNFSQNIVWVKNKAPLSWSDYNWQHEPILYGWKPGAAHYFAGDFTLTTVIDDEQDPEEMTKDELLQVVHQIRAQMPSSVIRADKPVRSELHPTMKPVGLVRRCINASSRHGEIVLDGFGGSGTTLIACETIGRQARLVEYDPIFVDVIIERWQEFTGLQAIRERDGVLFDDQKEKQAA